jgi:GDP-4-dehydro-6-deoxy-D-mannose reductase
VRALVFGGTGFVGRHLVAALREDGHDVVATGRDPRRGPPPAPGAVHAAADVLDEGSVFSAVELAQPERVFHLAGLASVARSFESEEAILRTNVLGTLHVLRAVKAIAPAARVLYIGSAQEYCRVPRERQPIAEDAPTAPVSPYGVSRAAASLVAQRFALAEGLFVVRTRSFNHTGPGHTLEYAAPSFADQLVRARRRGARGPVEVVTGSLDVARDFSGVAGVVRAYRALLERGAPGEVYNVCSGQAVTMGEMLARIARIVGIEAVGRLDPEKRRTAEIPYLLGDPRKLEAATGVSLAGSLDEGLAALVRDREKAID